MCRSPLGSGGFNPGERRASFVRPQSLPAFWQGAIPSTRSSTLICTVDPEEAQAVRN